MGKTADVQQSIWSDPWFHGLRPHAKLLYLWAITTQHGNLAGLFTIAEQMVMMETGLTQAQMRKAADELEGKVHYNPENGVMWVVARAKHVRSKTVQIATSIARAVKECPDQDVRNAFVARYSGSRWLGQVLQDEELALVTTTSRGIPPKTRAKVFERDDFKCVDCGSPDNLTIDHIRPESHGGGNGESNLAVRCHICNVSKGSALPSQILEPHIEVPSQSQSQSQSKRAVSSEQQNGKSPSRSVAHEWDEWIEHYRETTGNSGVTGSKPARESFVARRNEGRSLADLKLATIGCHGDEYNRSHGHNVPETILRVSKVERYIVLAKQGPHRDEHPADKRVRELGELAERLKREEAAA